MCDVNSIYFWFKKYFPEKTHSFADSKRRKRSTNKKDKGTKGRNATSGDSDKSGKAGQRSNKKRLSAIKSSRRRNKGKIKKGKGNIKRS